MPGLCLAAAEPAPRVLPGQIQPTLKDAKPDEHGIHRMVILRGLNKTTGRAIDIAAPVGYPVQFGTLTITAFYCHTVPPEEPPETSAFLQIDDTPTNGKPMRIFSGWMFASSPALHPLEHAVYDVWVLTCKTDEPPPTPSPDTTSASGAAKPPVAAAPKPAAPSSTPATPPSAAPVPPRPSSREPTETTTP